MMHLNQEKELKIIIIIKGLIITVLLIVGLMSTLELNDQCRTICFTYKSAYLKGEYYNIIWQTVGGIHCRKFYNMRACPVTSILNK